MISLPTYSEIKKLPKESRRQLIRKLCWESLYYFNVFCFVPMFFPKDERLMLKEHIHKVACDHMQRRDWHRKGLMMPRSFLKSHCITQVKPTWDWWHNPDCKIGIINETDKMAKKFMSYIKASYESNEYLHYYAPECKIPKEWQKSHQWSSEGLFLPRRGLDKEPSIVLFGIGGAAQGTHVDELYLDDLIGKKAKQSQAVRKDTKDWFDNVGELLRIRDPNSKGASYIHLIGTHWAPGDLYCEAKESSLGYKFVTITAEDEHGQPTWPEKMSAEEIARMKSDPGQFIVFYTQYQNNPLESDLTDFKRDWLRYYERVKNEKGEPAYTYTYNQKKKDEWEEVTRTVNESELRIKATLDPAYSESKLKSTARTAIIIVGTDNKTGRKLVLESFARRIGKPSELYKEVFHLNDRYHPESWEIDALGPQKFVLQSIREKAREKGIFLPIRSVIKDVGKDAKEIRIRSLREDFEPAHVLIHKDMQNLISEYLSFPMGQTRDLLDALSYHKKDWRAKMSSNLQGQINLEEEQYRQNANPVTGYSPGY